MSINISETSKFDSSVITKVINSGEILSLTTHSLPRETQVLITQILSEFLNQTGFSSYFPKLNYCMSEIFSNALKANMKREYFKEKHLDIENMDDYIKGMESFRNDTFAQKNRFFQLLETSDHYINFSLRYINNSVIIEVRNNATLTPVEIQRITARFKNVHQITVDEFDGELIDESEGAGLGIRSILLALISFGLDTDHYQLFVEENETVSKMIIEEPLLTELEELEDLEEL